MRNMILAAGVSGFLEKYGSHAPPLPFCPKKQCAVAQKLKDRWIYAIFPIYINALEGCLSRTSSIICTYSASINVQNWVFRHSSFFKHLPFHSLFVTADCWVDNTCSRWQYILKWCDTKFHTAMQSWFDSMIEAKLCSFSLTRAI